MTKPADLSPERLRDLASQGKSDTELADILGVTQGTVFKYRQKYGIPSHYKHPAKHGTRTRYAKGCRCDPCKTAGYEYRRQAKGSQPNKHGTYTAYSWNGCRCDECKAAGARKAARDDVRFKDALRKAGRDDIHTRDALAFKARNDKSRQEADRWGYLWTGPELEVISREDLTAPQAAAMLGRTIAAVTNQRKRLRDGIPKKLRTRGLVGDDAPH